MGKLNIFYKPTVAAAFVVWAVFGQSVAAQTAEVSNLLVELRDADPADAQKIAEKIRLEWRKSGSASADFLLKRGRDALERQDFASAIDHLTALVDHAPEFAEGWVARSSAYYQSELLGPAVSDLEHALALNPQHFEAIVGLAVVFEVIGRPKEAYAAYAQLKAIHPHHPAVTEAMQRLEQKARGPVL